MQHIALEKKTIKTETINFLTNLGVSCVQKKIHHSFSVTKKKMFKNKENDIPFKILYTLQGVQQCVKEL